VHYNCQVLFVYYVFVLIWSGYLSCLSGQRTTLPNHPPSTDPLELQPVIQTIKIYQSKQYQNRAQLRQCHLRYQMQLSSRQTNEQPLSQSCKVKGVRNTRKLRVKQLPVQHAAVGTPYRNCFQACSSDNAPYHFVH